MINDDFKCNTTQCSHPNPWYWDGGLLQGLECPAGWYWYNEAEQLGDGVTYPTESEATAALREYVCCAEKDTDAH